MIAGSGVSAPAEGLNIFECLVGAAPATNGNGGGADYNNGRSHQSVV